MPEILDRITKFARTVNFDAEILLGHTVLKATGQNYVDYIQSGKVPPLNIFFKAYAASAHYNLVQSLKPAGIECEIQNVDGEVIGHSTYTRVPDHT